MEERQYFLHLIQNITYPVVSGKVPEPPSLLKKLPIGK